MRIAAFRNESVINFPPQYNNGKIQNQFNDRDFLAKYLNRIYLKHNLL